MNYAALTVAIYTFVQNTEVSFLAQIPNFVRMAERRICLDAELPLTRSTAVLSTAVGVDTLSLTAVAGYQSVESVAVQVASTYRYLDNKTEEFLRSAFPDPTVVATPRLYSVDTETELTLAPTPDAEYPVQLRYWAYPESMVDTLDGTSWLGANFDQALLYGALRDAGVYLKEEADVLAMYEGKYAEGIAQIKQFASTRAVLDTYRTRG